MSFGQSRARIYAEDDVSVSFADVAGVDEAEDELEMEEALEKWERAANLYESQRLQRAVTGLDAVNLTDEFNFYTGQAVLLANDGKPGPAWNLLEQRGIDNVVLLGVHTNMCVLGRPFGLRQMAKNGKNVVLVRDLTDTMYNPAMWPYVNHHTGTDLIVEHIEEYVCPTVLSTDVVGGKPHRFFDDKRPTVAVVISEFEYETYETLPAFAQDHPITSGL